MIRQLSQYITTEEEKEKLKKYNRDKKLNERVQNQIFLEQVVLRFNNFGIIFGNF